MEHIRGTINTSYNDDFIGESDPKYIMPLPDIM